MHVSLPLYHHNGYTVLPLPEALSSALPSRGPVMVEGTLNGIPFRSVLEPDGRKGHCLILEPALAAQLPLDTPVALTLSVSDDWGEASLPTDMQRVLEATPELWAVWEDLTPLARWEWLRWVRDTASAATRAKRLRVMQDQLQHGKRRPCCFDHARCTLPAIAKGGKLAIENTATVSGTTSE
ncbi:DUF1905 domain-containing protein [Candidatus Peribacteria bacterium]|nr:DUF1905 domain-containing protein [Candidatus Peribacteria bacterium]